jgi:hypothetical protein
VIIDLPKQTKHREKKKKKERKDNDTTTDSNKTNILGHHLFTAIF